MRVLGLWNTRQDYWACTTPGIEVHVSNLQKGDIVYGTTWWEPTSNLDSTPREIRAQIDRIEEGEDEDGKFFMLYYDDEYQPARLRGSWAKVRTTKITRSRGQTTVETRPAIITVVDVNNEREEFLKENPNYVERAKRKSAGKEA